MINYCAFFFEGQSFFGFFDWLIYLKFIQFEARMDIHCLGIGILVS